MEELHLFIIWENALDKKEVILDDISKNFEVLKKYMIKWSLDKFSENLSRFYGTNLPKGSGKEQHCGTGPFMLIIVKDKNPIYEKRPTSRGEETVNINMFDKKTYYRELTGGGHRIHATNNPAETNHDLTLLLDMSVEDFLKNKQTKEIEEIEEIEKDLFGANGWEDVSQMFYALNNCTKYALLRNYETLPEEIYVNEHNDIDLICESNENCAYVLNATKIFSEEYRVHYVTNVQDKKAYFDLRFLGDNYYYEELEKSILETRVFNEKGFYTIENTLYFYTLLYHALIHKKTFAQDYKKRLVDMNVENISENTSEDELLKVLEKWLIKNEYIIKIPQDISVMFNKENSNKLSKLVYRNEEEITKLEERVSNLNTENTQLKQELEKIVNSRSWKSTEFIRKIRLKLKK